MDQVQLKAFRRETGKKSAKETRQKGLVPGVFYVKGEEPIALAAHPLALRPIIYTAHSKLISLQFDGDSAAKSCILKDATFDPVTDKLLHFDLQGISGDKITVEVPVTTTGNAAGILQGGIVLHNLHKVVVHCDPHNIPDSIVVDITNLGLGKSIHLSDIPAVSFHFDAPLETVVVSVVAPRVSATGQAEQTAESASEAE
jgi:large subunit ribosomal protein L25